MESEKPFERIFAYHERTKHHFDRYARSPGYLDWANQPDPFRTYAGAPAVDLPLLADAVTASYDDLHIPGKVPPRRPDLHSIAIIFELALGLSAWKQFQSNRWALRCNPSSGNLHPTEGYIVTPALPGLSGGVYHYVSRDHRLEQRCALDDANDRRLRAVLPEGCFLVGLSSIHWREAWKYGERAFRYCQHDAGHAIAAVRYAAACVGLRAILLDSVSDETTARTLGLDRPESSELIDRLDAEHPDALLLVGPGPLPTITVPADLSQSGTWSGQANSLSANHVEWRIIDETARVTRKPETESSEPIFARLPTICKSSSLPAATLIRQRRSALGFDRQTTIGVDRFHVMLDRLHPRAGVPPGDALPWEPHLHLAIFVHRVQGLTAGLYFFERNESVHDRIRQATNCAFQWQRVSGLPAHLRLFRLQEGDLRRTARDISCHQEIAADGAFSLGMVADFSHGIQAKGPWWYRRLFWEAGTLGQVLYLEAEAAGLRSTGIGCYFDDACHDLLGLKGNEFQSLYHFTVGGAVEDPRLQTIPAYSHLDER
jgi:SagB-type dehydrogenase family enzyme